MIDDSSLNNVLRNTRPELLVKMRSPIQGLLDRTRDFGKLVGHLAKIGAALSVIVGMTLLVGYLHSAGAGLPSIDTSFGAILTFLTVIFLWFSLVAVLFILMPALVMVINAKNTRGLFPELHSEPPFTTSYFRAYVSYFRPFLFMVIVFFVGLEVSAAHPHYNTIIAVRLTLGATLAAGLLGLCWLYFSLKRRYGKERAAGAVLGSLSATGVSFFWLILFAMTAVIVLDRKLSNWSNAPWAIIGMPLVCFVCLIGVHHVLTANSTFLNIGILALICMVASAVIGPGIPFMGGAALRFVGIGGGLPIIMLIKTMEPGAGQIVAKEVKGCLILATGDSVLVSRGEPTDKCRPPPALVLFGDLHVSSETHNVVERYAVADVLRLSRFTQPNVRAER